MDRDKVFCGEGACKCCYQRPPTSVAESLTELDFSRGIWSAAADGNVRRVEEILLKHPDAVNQQDSGGYCALHYAARNGHMPTCKLIIQHGADVNIRTRAGGTTPLHRAALMGHCHILKCLLAAGADPLLLDNDGKNALHKAAEKGDASGISLLMSADSSAAQQADNKGRLPIHCLPVDASKDLRHALDTSAVP